MTGDAEVTIIVPDRTTAPPRNGYEALARDGNDTMANGGNNEPRIQTLTCLQHQHCPDLHGRGPALGSKGHQIVRAGPLNVTQREHFLTLSEMSVLVEKRPWKNPASGDLDSPRCERRCCGSRPSALCDPHGVTGHLSNVVTDPAFRRTGLARACVEQLLTWFRDATDAIDVDLFATENGADLYESLGFDGRPNLSVRLSFRRG